MQIFRRHGRSVGMVLVLAAVSASTARAGGSVQLEIVSEKRAGIMATQNWMRALGQAGVRNVRIRQARPSDKVGIDVRGAQRSRAYTVTGRLTAGGELLLPGGRYRQGDAAGVARWLDELARRGLPEDRPRLSAFGLEAEQYRRVRADLARPVAFSTKNVDRAQVLQRIARSLENRLAFGGRATDALEGDKVAEELAGLSSGTAIACVLRPTGYCMVPRVAGGRVSYAVVRARAGMEIWPIGWKSDKRNREVLPALYEFLNVNIQGVPVSQALEAIAGRLKVTYLLDHNALARHGIDPAKSVASLPKSRTFYSKALERLLFQAGLKSELRVDEAGRPLLWITSIKPM